VITEIKVLNRKTMDKYASGEEKCPFSDRQWHLISIHGSSSNLLTNRTEAVLNRNGMVSGLSVEFWDITDNPEALVTIKREYPDYVMFDLGHAKKILKFLNEIKDETGERLLVCQCDAGMSRSMAVGEFACELYELNYKNFAKYNRKITSNPLVLKLLREESGIGGQKAFMTEAEAKEAKVEQVFGYQKN
jgi:predicted protein tyrosine phosphatase